MQIHKSIGPTGSVGSPMARAFPPSSGSVAVGRALLLIFLIPYVAGTFRAQAQLYNITDLGTLGGPTSTAWGLNNHGQIVGWSDTTNGQSHGFVWSSGQMRDLGTFGGTNSYAHGINEHGFVVGSAANSNNVSRAFLYDTTNMLDLGTLGGNLSVAKAIDSRNRIVGESVDTAGNVPGFLYETGKMSRLPINTAFCIPDAINDAGQVVGEYAGFGQHAFLYSQDGFHDLGVLAGVSFTAPSAAYGINASGNVVGWSTSSTLERRAFIYSNGLMKDLGTLLPPGYLETSTAYGINNAGQIVGVSTATFTREDHAFLFQNGTMLDFNSLVPSGAGWLLQEAHRINDRGQVVGTGMHNGASHAFLASPPELAILLSGDTAVISWPGWAATYIVETTTNSFVPRSWFRLTAPPAFSDGRFWITNGLGATGAYFRLHAP